MRLIFNNKCRYLAEASERNPSGKTWQRRESNTDNALHAIWFASETEGWIVGWKGTTLRSTDSGKTWQQQQNPTNKTLNSLWITRGRIPWVVGESGLMLKYEGN